MLNLFRNNSDTANLTLLGLAGNAGEIKFSDEALSRFSVSLVHQSVTGFYEQRQDLSLGDHA